MTTFFLSCFLLPAAFVLDFFFGDPRWKFHPVRIMGSAIEKSEPWFRKTKIGPVISGALFALTLIGLTFALSAAFMNRLWHISPISGFMVETVLIYFCISTTELRRCALGIYEALACGNAEGAREQVSMIVGREVDRLDEEGISGACVETVAENLVDGIIAPFFFAALGGAPLALTYKMINTLDSMVGYRSEKYLLFGKTAAKIDDFANYLPARLSVPIIALSAQILAGKGRDAFQTAKKEGRLHSSPNAGYPEAAFSGTFSIRLGGPNYYHGKLVKKPFIGRRFGRVNLYHIPQACDLMMLASILALFLLLGFDILIGGVSS